MNWKFADLTLDGRQYTVTQADSDLFVAVHYARYMPRSVRWLRTSRRVDPKGRLGSKLVEMAKEQWRKS